MIHLLISHATQKVMAFWKRLSTFIFTPPALIIYFLLSDVFPLFSSPYGGARAGFNYLYYNSNIYKFIDFSNNAYSVSNIIQVYCLSNNNKYN